MSYHVRKSFLAYKAAYVLPFKERGLVRFRNKRVLITLRIPKGALLNEKPPMDFPRKKLRANRARVISIRLLTAKGAFSKKKQKLTTSYAGFHLLPPQIGSPVVMDFVYKTGAVVKPRYKFDISDATCSSGIHFFRNKQRAMDYYP